MFQMDEKIFAELQKDCCWFTLPIFEQLPEVDPNKDVLNDPIWRNDTYVQRHIFAMIFGGFGCSIDLENAKLLATIKFGQVEKHCPKDKSIENPAYVRWLGLYAQYNILLGTIFAYLHNYPMAAYLLMNGLKSRAVNLFLPYCDFIKYILAKVSDMPSEPAEYFGCGFSADEPMGGIELNGGTLLANMAEMIIPALEGDDGEQILAFRGNQIYGNLKRRGSTNSHNFRNCIDIYDVLLVTRQFKIKRLRLYFNGYFTRENRYLIKPPQGFHLNPWSEEAQIFKVSN
jgi:hypothetical protein